MSVASKRQEMLDWVKSGGHHDLRNFIEELILEVQAEMPCYDHWTERLCGEPCESCAAREKLKMSGVGT